MEKGGEKLLLMLVMVAWEGVVSRRSTAADEYELTRPSVMPSREPVRTFKTEEGDVVDCVHIYAQPALDHPLLKNHVIQFAAVRGVYVGGVLGAVGVLNIWSPQVEPNEYSASRIIVLSGTSDGQLYQDHILAGWIANGTTGCFNLDCPGFVQVSSTQYFGGSLPSSVYDKVQVQIFVGIFKDEDGNWWLQFEKELLNRLALPLPELMGQHHRMGGG
ncbi:unnamed protein product [Victoria cruziana]